jgi:hypothetical protein
LAAYVLITYRPSQIHPELLSAVESIIVTPLTDPWEVGALTRLCGVEGAESEWGNLLADEIRKVEKQFRRGRVANLSESLVKPIRERYELTS